MSIEIIPAGSSAVVTDHGRDHHGHHHPDRYDIVSQAEVHATAAALAASHTDEENREDFGAMARQVSEVEGRSLVEAAKNAAALSVQGQKQSADLSGQATANFNLSAVQATANFNALTTQANLVQYNVLLDAQKNAAAAELRAQRIAADAAAQAAACCCELKERIAQSELLAVKNAAAAAAQLAECCCELKEKIDSDGDKTREILRAQKEQDLRDRAQRAEAAVTAYFSAKVPPVSPIS